MISKLFVMFIRHQVLEKLLVQYLYKKKIINFHQALEKTSLEKDFEEKIQNIGLWFKIRYLQRKLHPYLHGKPQSFDFVCLRFSKNGKNALQ